MFPRLSDLCRRAAFALSGCREITWAERRLREHAEAMAAPRAEAPAGVSWTTPVFEAVVFVPPAWAPACTAA